ncbi:HepT-like ribonuclease domain-containing protein [Aestuariimicrobium ganziense]|uniref:HepT-like ribonuclease domain-containing protein n=1 Tax=Aestuariimicrobium ganziense TaxID=2773677 RepID=UPI0019414A6C|nr:HepT-like ribonuclease domain-containing protein [Aestuariimicrobium ganziense]
MRREGLLLEEMIDAAEQIMLLLGGIDAAALQADRLRRDAVLWNFSVLGEAAGRLPADFRLAHAKVDWISPTQMRNRIVHGYWTIEVERLLDTAAVDLPGYVQQMRAVLATVDDQ